MKKFTVTAHYTMVFTETDIVAESADEAIKKSIKLF